MSPETKPKPRRTVKELRAAEGCTLCKIDDFELHWILITVGLVILCLLSP